MSEIQVKKVETSRDRRLFLTFPWRIYKNDPLWVPPILSEREKAIDPDRGAFFQRGDAECFIAWREGRPVGTICAGEDKVGNRLTDMHDTLWGFFDCIEDYCVAEALWQQVIAWGKERGLKSMYGPFNLDYEDSYGILVEGRDRPPALLCGHTPEYYLDFVQRFGFQPGRAANIAFAVRVDADQDEFQRMERIADRVRQRGRFNIRTPDFDHWEDEIDPLLALMNAALAHLPGHIPWQRESLRSLLEPFKKIADPELILFAEEDGKTIGFFPGVPNLNEVLIHANGLRYPWDYLKAWWYSRRQPECVTIKSVIVPPDYWGSGVAVLLFDEMLKRVQAKGYKWIDLSLTSVDNPKTPILAERMGGRIYKRYQVYRYWFD